MKLALAIAALLASSSTPAMKAGEDVPRLAIIQRVALPALAGSVPPEELSGLAYSRESNRLYAISDRGWLHGFKLEQDVTGKWAAFAESSVALDMPVLNGEGLAMDPASTSQSVRLIGAFEDGPAIVSFSANGDDPVELALPNALRSPLAFAEAGSRLESVAIDGSGRTLTAPEEALRNRPDTVHTIYRSDGAEFSFPVYQTHRSNLKAMEIIENGKLLVLERIRNGDVSEMRLRLVNISNCERSGLCPVEELVADKPDCLIGNFEGLARISANVFAAVTDSKADKEEVPQLLIFNVEGIQAP